MVSRGFRDPRCLNRHSEALDKCFQDLFRKWQDADPPPQPQLALPVPTIKWFSTVAATSPAFPWLQAVADLIILAFFFLLRVGEYTTPSGPRQTIPLQKQHIKLWIGETLIPPDASPATRLTATAVTINLMNQKNGHRNAILHHTTTNDPLFCPVQAAARRLNALHDMPPDTPICTWHTIEGNASRVTSTHIVQALRLSVRTTGLDDFALDKVGSHSLRASGAMALKLNGFSDNTIRKLGRWSTNTFDRYIHAQIGALTANVATAMATSLRFHNVAAAA